MPRLSVVIPAYNNADFLDETIRSVLSQSFDDFELIIADHSSTDGTRAVAERFLDDARVRVIDTPTGGGAPRNWNRVSAEAVGDYLKLVCGDDILEPGVLERQVRALDENPTVVLAAVARDIVDVKGVPIVRARGFGKGRGVHRGTVAVRASVRAGTNLFGEPACVMMRREALEAAGGWDGRFPYLIDQATYSQVLLTGDFYGDDESGAAFRLNGGQWSVALASSQGQQASEFHEWLHDARPDVVSVSDARIGSLRARAMAFARRAVYVAFARRMKVENAA